MHQEAPATQTQTQTQTATATATATTTTTTTTTTTPTPTPTPSPTPTPTPTQTPTPNNQQQPQPFKTQETRDARTRAHTHTFLTPSSQIFNIIYARNIRGFKSSNVNTVSNIGFGGPRIIYDRICMCIHGKIKSDQSPVDHSQYIRVVCVALLFASFSRQAQDEFAF